MHWYPIYAFLRAAGLEADDAAARTESTLTRFIEKEPGKGASLLLREWLRTLAQETLAEEGVREPLLTIARDWAAERFAAESPRSPDETFARRWTLGLIEGAMTGIEEEYRVAGRGEVFAAAQGMLGFSGGGEGADAYLALATQLGLSEGAARKAVFDLRTRYRELLRAGIADTVASEEQIGPELSALLVELPAPAATAPPRSVLRRLNPEELLARGMNSVKISTVGGLGWTPPSVEQAARLFPNYEVVATLGHGGMGAVYQARQTSLDRLVAIKLLPLEISVDRDFADRFRREARAMAKLNHPNIISVHDFGQTSEGHLYFVMEFVDGANLHELIHKGGEPLPPAEALGFIEQVCDALAYAHGKGIVHRDIKPANVMIEREGRVKVADFGLARLSDGASAEQWGSTRTGLVMGTLEYMAPEQKRGLHVDHRADIYALGVMLYESLCKETPQGAFLLPSKHCGLDKRLDPIITKALASQPESRFQSTTEMKAAIALVRPAVGKAKKVRPAVAVSALASSPRTAVSPPAARSRRIIYVGIAAALAALFGGAIHFKKAKPNAPMEKAASARLLTPGTATKSAPFVNMLGMKFVPVPGTKVLFSIWDTRVQDYREYARVNSVDGAWQTQQLADTPVSREPEDPVVAVSWDDARGFCRWLTDKESAGGKLPPGARYRLPTDEEWSIAVGLPPEEAGTPKEKSRKNTVDYPWGTGFPPRQKVGSYADSTLLEKNPHSNWEVIRGYNDGYVTTSPVGSFPANTIGLFDMGGNVWQWCEDWYDASQKERVMRGASWPDSRRETLHSSTRIHPSPLTRSHNFGFRCVLDPTPTAAAAAVNPAPGKLSVDEIKVEIEKIWKEETEDLRRLSRFELIAANNPGVYSYQLYNGLRHFYGISGKEKESLRASDTILSNEPMHGYIVGIVLASNHLRDGDKKKAIESLKNHLQKANGFNFVSAACLIQLGDLYRAENDASTARSYYERVLQLSGIAGSTYPNLAKERLAIIAPVVTTPAKPESTTHLSATKEQPFVNSLGMRFVPVPIISGPTSGQRVLFSVWETRVQDYEVFAKETKREWGKPEFEQGPMHPAVLVSWGDAKAFCAWLTERERKTGKLNSGELYRLPSDHEWCVAGGLPNEPLDTPARLHRREEVYPWGRGWPAGRNPGNLGDQAFHERFPTKRWLQGYTDGFATTSPAGSFPPTAAGLYDLTGNVWEYCEDRYEGGSTGNVVVHGSSWKTEGRPMTSVRWGVGPDDGHANATIGFRIILAADPVAPSPALASATAVTTGAATKDGLFVNSFGIDATAITPAAATKERPYVNTLGMKLVPIPITGGPTSGQWVLFSVWETRVQDYAHFAKETNRAWQKPKFEQGPTHPVVKVKWEDAQKFCAWLTAREQKAGKLDANKRYRLPSDHEWSCAVGIGERETATPSPLGKNGRIEGLFPWGLTWPPPPGAGSYPGAESVGHEVYGGQKPIPGFSDPFPNTAPVGTFEANRLGLFDLAGNVWEFCEDIYDPRSAEAERVVRGASYSTGYYYHALSSCRLGRKTESTDAGFRVVLAPAAGK